MPQPIDLTDPQVWTAPGIHDEVARIRRSTPVFQHETRNDGPIWSVLSYAAAVAVLSTPEDYGSQHGSLLGTVTSGRPAGAGKMMALCDPPRHRELRDPMTPLFSARSVSTLRRRIAELTAEVVERAINKQEVDFVHDVGAAVPTTVMCDMMGVPDADRDRVVDLCDRAFLEGTPALRRAAHQQLIPYLYELTISRWQSPGSDLVSVLAGRDEQPDLEEVVLNCDNVIVGGVQTVRHTAAMGLRALIDHPDAWQALRDGSVRVDTAVEELLRWTSVGLHVLRTARRDTELSGRRILNGDRVVVWTPAANRDDGVFPDAQRLDLSRHPNRHIAFGWGPHYCIGAHLARLELQALFTELTRRVAVVEPLDEPSPNLSIINFGFDRFPVRLHPR